MSSNIAERKETILRMLAEDQSISVSALSKQLGVTVVTTRSDVATLEAEGYLVRTHGGAIPTRHPKIMERIQKTVMLRILLPLMPPTLLRTVIPLL